MTVFKQTKDAIMLLITIFVLTLITGFLYIILGGYQIGSAIDVTDEEARIVAFRTFKCLDRNEKLDECIKTDKYGIKINHMNKVFYVNKELYVEYDESGVYDVHILRNPVNKIFKDSKGEPDFAKTEVRIIFKNE